MLHQPPYYATSWQEHDDYVEFYNSLACNNVLFANYIEEPYGGEANMIDEMCAIERDINNIDIF